jgi:protein-tyrosine phosphatase
MASLLRHNGVDAGAFKARRLTETLVKDADLVLTLTRAQRSLVVELWPPAVRRTFTVREFARLLDKLDSAALGDGIPAERLRAAMPLAAAQRSLQRSSAKDDDVIDPFRLSDEIYAASFDEITSAVNVIVGVLGCGKRNEPRGGGREVVAIQLEMSFVPVSEAGRCSSTTSGHNSKGPV